MASSSWFGTGRGSPGSAKARAAAMLSVKLIRAMPGCAGPHRVRPGRDAARPATASSRGTSPTVVHAHVRAGRAEREAADAHRHRDQRRRRARREVLQAEQISPSMARASSSVGIEVCGQVVRHGDQVPEEARLLDVNAEQLRDLVHDDHQADAGLEAGEHGFGNEVGDKPEPQQRGAAPAWRRRGSQASRRPPISSAGTAAGHRLTELGCCENGDRRRGADAQRPRGAQQRVDDHRHERRVEAHLHRQAGDGGVRHRLGDHDGGRDQAGDDVRSQPIPGYWRSHVKAGMRPDCLVSLFNSWWAQRLPRSLTHAECPELTQVKPAVRQLRCSFIKKIGLCSAATRRAG